MGVLRNGSIMVMKATTILLAMSVMLMFNIASAYFPYTSLPPPLCSPYYYLKSNLFYGCQIGFMHGLACCNNLNFHNTNENLLQKHYKYIRYTGILLKELSSSNYLQIAFIFGLQALQSIDFSRIYWLNGLEPKNDGYLQIVWRFNFITKCTFLTYYVCKLGTLFDEIKSSNYLQIAIVFGLQTL